MKEEEKYKLSGGEGKHGGSCNRREKKKSKNRKEKDKITMRRFCLTQPLPAAFHSPISTFFIVQLS